MGKRGVNGKIPPTRSRKDWHFHRQAAAERLERRRLFAGATYSISPNPASVNENAYTLDFTVTRSDSSTAATVYASTVHDQGYSNNGEYDDLSHQAINFSAGKSSALIEVEINDLGLVSGSETFRVMVQQSPTDPASTYLATDNFTIVNNDVGGNPGPMKGLDARDVAIAEYAPQLHAAGNGFIGQYIGEDITYLTAADATPIEKSGLQLISIFAKPEMSESNSSWETYFTNAQGAADAAAAASGAQHAQQSDGSAIYFKIDLDPATATGTTEAAALAAIDQYFRGIQSYFAGLQYQPYSVGVYGAGDTLTQIMNDGLAKYSWLASPTNWSGYTTWEPAGATSHLWNIHQVQDLPPQSQYGNIAINTDETSGLPIGAWNPPTHSISPNPTSANENAGTLTFTVSRLNNSTAETLYASTVQDQGYANNGNFVGLSNQTISFAVGQSTAQVSVTINDLGLTSGSETYHLVLQQSPSDPVTSYLAADAFTIVNNDPAKPVASNDSYNGTEWKQLAVSASRRSSQ